MGWDDLLAEAQDYFDLVRETNRRMTEAQRRR